MSYCKTKFLNGLLSVTFLFFITLNVQAADTIKVKFAIQTLETPSQKYAKWSQFVEYLELKTGFDIKIIFPKSYIELENAIDRNEVNMLFTNAYVFYRLKQKGKVLGLAQGENINGGLISHSKIFVHSDRGINKIEDLKGKNISFVTPFGMGGYLAPRALFQKHGINTKKDLTEHFSNNVKSSINSVVLNDVQAGIVCKNDYQLVSNKIDTGVLKIIALSDNYPESLVSASTKLNQSTREKLEFFILEMMQEKKGKEIIITILSKQLKELKEIFIT